MHFALQKKYIYALSIFVICTGFALGLVINIRVSIMFFLLIILCIIDHLTRSVKNIDGIYIFLFMALFPLNRICLAVTQPDTLLLRYVNDYCNLSTLDLMTFLLFLRLLHKRTNYKKYDSCYILLTIFFMFNILSITQSTNISATVWTCVRCIKLYIIFEYFKYIFDFYRHKNYLVKGGLVAIIPQFLISVMQYLKRDVIGLSILGEVNSLAERNVDGSTSIRPSGTFEHPANMAFFALFVFMLCLHEEKIEKNKRIIVMFCSLVLVLFSGSRAIMGLTVLVIVLWIKENGLKSKKNLVSMLICSSLLFSVAILTSVFSSIVDIFVNSDWSEQIINRTTQWVILMSYIIQKPILGYGANTYTDITSSIASVTSIITTRFYLSNPCHNIYLQLWFDLGIGGMTAYVMVLVNALHSYIKMKRKISRGENKILISCFTFVCVLITYNFTGWAGLKDQTNYMLYMVLGLLFSVNLHKDIYQKNEQEEKHLEYMNTII